MPNLSLLRQHSPLADPAAQRQILADAGQAGIPEFAQTLADAGQAGIPEFAQTLADAGLAPLTAAGIDILQVNLGKLCNQTCRHCHVDAGPDRREVMDAGTIGLCLNVLRRHDIGTLDITGGAPEMNPGFRDLVRGASSLGRRIIDRCNLTILVAPGFDDLPEFLAEHRVDVVASLPCYLAANVDQQRGDGVFQRSLEALRRLNQLGYGREGGSLRLTLVFNPVGPSLPPPQQKLEADYRRELRARYGIEFTDLYTITNMPISRFLDDLLAAGRWPEYLQKLVAAFNPATVPGLMCRNTLSVDWTGRLFDCDFNQMLDLPVASSVPRHIRDFALGPLASRQIVTARHCFGCTAGTGSGCGGSLVT